MLGTWIWWLRLRHLPARFEQLRDNRNWLAFVGRFALAGQKTDLLATAHNFQLDHDGFTFGTLYEAREDISIGPLLGPLERGQRYYFMGFGSLPHDGISDYFFEAMDGTALHLIFETMRGSDVKAAQTKLINDRLLSPILDNSARTRELKTVRWLLTGLRKRNKVH